MVKRAISIVLGAAAGVALWLVFNAVLMARSHAEPGTEGCLREAFVECVGFEKPQPPAIEPARPIAAPCKGWLSATNAGSVVLLSQCLHQARSDRDAQRFEQIKRAQALATSS